MSLAPIAPGSRAHYGFRDVLAAIPDKARVAATFGLELVGEPNHRGWVKCRRLDREDRNPSAGFNVLTGYYCEPPDGRRLSLFDVAVERGYYPDASTACDDLGSRYAAAS